MRKERDAQQGVNKGKIKKLEALTGDDAMLLGADDADDADGVDGHGVELDVLIVELGCGTFNQLPQSIDDAEAVVGYNVEVQLEATRAPKQTAGEAERRHLPRVQGVQAGQRAGQVQRRRLRLQAPPLRGPPTGSAKPRLQPQTAQAKFEDLWDETELQRLGDELQEEKERNTHIEKQRKNSMFRKLLDAKFEYKEIEWLHRERKELNGRIAFFEESLKGLREANMQ